MHSPVVHWEIGGRDLDALAEFYRELFGWEATDFDPDYRLIDFDGGIGGGLMRCREGNAIGLLRPETSDTAG